MLPEHSDKNPHMGSHIPNHNPRPEVKPLWTTQ